MVGACWLSTGHLAEECVLCTLPVSTFSQVSPSNSLLFTDQAFTHHVLQPHHLLSLALDLFQ